MHLSIFPAVALAATYVLAVPVDLDERQSEITRTQSTYTLPTVDI